MDAFTPLILRNRDAPSPSLRVEWALLRLLDRGHCKQLEEDLAEMAEAWEIHVATESLWNTLPDEAGIYLFVWRPHFSFEVAERRKPGSLSQVLYVGRAGGESSNGTLAKRYKSYRKAVASPPASLWDAEPPRKREQLLERYLSLRPLEYWCAVAKDKSRIAELEERLIMTLNPPCNRRLTPTLIPRPAEPAF